MIKINALKCLRTLEGYTLERLEEESGVPLENLLRVEEGLTVLGRLNAGKVAKVLQRFSYELRLSEILISQEMYEVYLKAEKKLNN